MINESFIVLLYLIDNTTYSQNLEVATPMLNVSDILLLFFFIYNVNNSRFIQVETAFFYLWWNEQNEDTKSHVRQLINEGRLEIINGAWSMNDEADVHYQSTIDQFTLGLRFIEDVLGKCGRPRGGWQIDPFGHSREHASLLTQMGMDSLFFARIDYRDRRKRHNEKTTDMIWKSNPSLGKF